MDVLPLVAVKRRADVVGGDLRLVEQMLNDEHDRCQHPVRLECSLLAGMGNAL